MSFVPSQTGGLQVLDRSVFPEGSTVFREGDNGSRAYIVQRGRIEFYRDVDGTNVLLGSVGKGGIFGEMALIDDKPRMATAVVAEAAVCIVISEAVFQKKLGATDPFLSGVLRVLVENIRSIQDQKQKTAHSETNRSTAEEKAAALMDELAAQDAAAPDDDAFEVA